MDRNSKNSEGYQLESQIREQYGKLTYTYTTQNEMITFNKYLNNLFEIVILILSVLTTGSIISIFGNVFDNEKISIIYSTIFSFLLLLFTLIEKSFKFNENKESYQKTVNDLYIIREEYLNLLTDFESLSEEEIKNKRNLLQKDFFFITKYSLRTNNFSYKRAQKKLKKEEYQYFSDEEIDKMLPDNLRRNNRLYFNDCNNCRNINKSH